MKLKSLIKCFFNKLASILFAFILFSGCSEIPTQTNNPSINILDEVNITSYCARELSRMNKIYYRYPQLNEVSSAKKTINGLILAHVSRFLDELETEEGGFNGNIKDLTDEWVWDWDGTAYDLYAIDVDYEITRFDDSYLSITFEGLFNAKFAAHPFHYFSSLIVDVHNEKLISLWDIYNVDDGFIDVAFSVLKEKMQVHGVAIEHEDPVYSLAGDSLKRILQSEGSDRYGHSFFLTEKAVGISISVPHAIGDHFEVLISYDELMEHEIPK